ncbi:MAG: orotate phosphoribosyltransferase [Eubacteriales bacterium]|nr:orotate phosphoribosyltransferase [Eubacteriales bacterium]
MLSQEEILNMFLESGALLEGHFLLTSGRHSNRYMQCARVLQYPRYAEKLGAALAEGFKDAGVEAVIGPAMGGIIVAHEVGRALRTRAFFTEREQGVMTLRRGFTLEPGTRVLVCEDVVTTGGSVREVMEVVREKGAQVVGVGVLVDRSGGKVDFGVPLRALLTMEIPSYDAAECPLCREGLPLVKPGSRQING